MSRAGAIAAADWRVCFEPRDDRFSQRILLAGETLLDSLDADEDFSDTWPPSPPLQEVHYEDRPDGTRLALGVGRAGNSHWSFSCELTPGAGELRFDLACRVKQPAAWLGNSYQLPSGVSFVGDAKGGELRGGGRVLCVSQAEADCAISFLPQAQRLILSPVAHREATSPDHGERFPRTIRWRYKFVLAPRSYS